ncbi:hypothetical protein HZC30_04690 [Candidatus Woesearchaeota archaeon]|nr:hypothetical protein [Candidatus Woesearchaeota archaeon]
MRPIISIITLIIVLSLVLFITSCRGGTPQSVLDYNFKQGIAEVKMKFMDNAPPDKIYPLSKFKIILELDNQAAYDITTGKVSLAGIVGDYFLMEETEKELDPLQGRSMLNPSGDKVQVEFSGTSGQPFANAKEYRNNYYLLLKYSSKMDFGATVCIHPGLYDMYDSGCKTEKSKSFSGQGAPLAVTNLEQIIYPSGVGAEVEYRLLVKNRGKGKVTLVTFHGAKLGGEPLECEFRQEDGTTLTTAKFNEKKQEAMLICKTFLKDQSSYLTTLSADFSYDYVLEEKHTLNLVK